MADQPLEILLTRLAGSPQLRMQELQAITASEWEALDARAAEHRIQALLHARWSAYRAVPEPLRAKWAEVRREGAVAALAQRRTLARLIARLEGAGLRALALKGSWLAWHVYPEAALRPLRDLDLLLAPIDAVAARTLLLASGWREAEPSALAPEDWLARFKHLPELVSPQGHWLDLHARLWDPAPGAPSEPPGLWANAVPDAHIRGLRYPAPEDQLMHLVIHAVMHRFDGGPLMLLDIDRLMAANAFDWVHVLNRAQDEGWRRPLDLVLAATRQWATPGTWNGPAETIETALIDDIPFFLAKPLAARASDIALRRRQDALRGPASAIRRVWKRRARYATTREWLAWLAGEARRALGGGAKGAGAARSARLEAYLAA